MTPTGAYAKCQDCGIDLADRDAVSAHGRDTMAPTGEQGIVARGHRVSIVNPTEEEQRASRVRSAIDRALEDLYAELDRDIDRGHFTEAEVKEQMVWFDLGDGWADYVAEAGT